LSSLLVYVLGRKPDEFGLIPDPDGFISYKELLQAIHEEPGWQYVTRSHIHEVLMGKDRPLFLWEENRIKVLERSWQWDVDRPSPGVPNILYTPIRTRAHPMVMERGLRSSEAGYLSLSPDREMALRIGKRRDMKPVVLEVRASAAQREAVLFYSFGHLFLSHEIPAKFIAGPSVSKEILEKKTALEAKKEKGRPAPPDFQPGTFFMDLSGDPDPHRRTKGKKPKGWKEKARGMRRGKRSF